MDYRGGASVADGRNKKGIRKPTDERRVAWWIIKQKGKRYYRYLRDNADYFTGEIAYHYNSNRNRYVTDVILYIVTKFLPRIDRKLQDR